MNCHTRTKLNYKLPAIWYEIFVSGMWHHSSAWFMRHVLKPLCCLTTMGKSNPVTWCHIPEERLPHLQCYEKLKSHILPYTQLSMPKCNTCDNNQYGLEVSYEVYQSIFGLLYALAISETKYHQQWQLDWTNHLPTLNNEVLWTLASMKNFKVW